MTGNDGIACRLARPIAPGAPVSIWQLGMLAETRYDVADQPMHGEMDPFFFVTKHKNFIPHEYPCRTAFAAERRGQRPRVTGAFSPARVWLPFGSPRVDLSGFWFRPTVLSTHARTMLVAQTAGPAQLRLATCGGAILWVNGEEVGYLAPYSRNLEADATFGVNLRAGDNEIALFFDDLAERDARYYVQLDYVAGPQVSVAIPGGDAPGLADAIETTLARMHFDRPAYTEGPVVFVLPVPLPVAARADVAIEGDFMSTERFARHYELAAGQARLVLGDVGELPADFRHFTVTLSAGGFAAARVFGVELCPVAAQGTAPDSRAARIAEALDWVADQAEPDTVRAIARLATGRGGPDTEAMIAAALPAIEDCHDCADFILVPLLWTRARQAQHLSPALVARIDAAILSYRYWMDEPGNDVQWYFSENHALLFHTAAYLAGHLLPEATFRRSGRKGAAQSAVGAARIRAWLDHFENWEMAEFNSAPYFPIDLKGLTALYALSPDGDISARAGKAIVRLLEIVAASAHHGVVTAAQGRSYEHTLRAGRTLELSAIARLVWGLGHFGRRYHCLPQLALCLRDHGLAIPAEFASVASLPAGQAQEWCFAQGQDRFARLYHHKTADHAIGSAAAYRWGQWGYQETLLHLRLGRNPDAQIWINQPGEMIHSGYARPSYWGGSASVPRVHQYRDLAVVLFDGVPPQPPLSHAWFPASVFEERLVEGHRAGARGGAGLALLIGEAPFEMMAEGPTAGNELRQPGLSTRWIIRLGDATRHGGLRAFMARFANLAIAMHDDGTLRIEDPEYGPVLCHSNGKISAEGRILDPEGWTVAGNRVTLPIQPLHEERPAPTTA